jgi:ribosome-binding factor A
MSGFRLERVANVIREEISAMILRGDIKDPRVDSMVILSRVVVSKDLSYAKVWVSSYQDHKKLEKTVEGLNSAAGFIQSVIAKKIRIRVTPHVSFVVDHSIEEGFVITEKIKQVTSEIKPE